MITLPNLDFCCAAAVSCFSVGTPSAASSGRALWPHPLCNSTCSARCQSGVCGKLAWHWAPLHSRRGRGWRFTAPQLLDSAYVAAELRSLRTRLTLAGNLWWHAALLRPSCHRWLDERSREQERPSLCAAELTRPMRHLYLGVARQCSLGGGASSRIRE